MKWLKETALNWLLKYSGANWLWDKFDGYKTYSAGVGSILLGASQLVAAYGASDGVSGFVELFKDSEAWALVLAGWYAVGQAHKAEKVAKEAAKASSGGKTQTKDQEDGN